MEERERKERDMGEGRETAESRAEWERKLTLAALEYACASIHVVCASARASNLSI